MPPAVITTWSEGEVFEIGGQPSVMPIGDTHDDTPLITWTPVLGAASYQVYLAPAAAVGSPVVNETGVTTTSYQVTDPLGSGDYRVWVRAFAFDGRVSPWSLNSQSLISVNGVAVPILTAIPNGSDTTPLFSWTPATGAVRYEIFVSSVASVSTAIIRDATITGTSYTSTTELVAGDYRYWVRAIGATGQNSDWSDPVRFTIVSLDNDLEQPTGDVLLASMAGVSGWSSENLSRAVPVELLGDTAQEQRSVATYDEVPAGIMTTSEPVSVDNDTTDPDVETSDEVMAGWDTAIWAEESAALTDEDSSPAEQPKGKGWLAGLAMLTPAVLRRRRRTERQD